MDSYVDVFAALDAAGVTYVVADIEALRRLLQQREDR